MHFFKKNLNKKTSENNTAYCYIRKNINDNMVILIERCKTIDLSNYWINKVLNLTSYIK